MAILMVKRSSISSFSRLPAGCVLFLLVALVLELFVFSRSYMLADVSTIAVIRNSHLIEEGHDRDMLLLGASRSLAVNARGKRSRVEWRQRYLKERRSAG